MFSRISHSHFKCRGENKVQMALITTRIPISANFPPHKSKGLPHFNSKQEPSTRLPAVLSFVIFRNEAVLPLGTGKARSLLSKNRRNPTWDCQQKNGSHCFSVYHFTPFQGHRAKRSPISFQHEEDRQR
ncbi:hypothetical protein AVEN_106502-1 [Araneus ventricosus]|uniref:Uncharacterized protein n=1 Tax=Araneus ventricosus TaxID=182803 RepID=A0A4Y2SBI8_ARAVE|nr:hypothetical protein AVEN_106502-1 [Araneus ventricosus]